MKKFSLALATLCAVAASPALAAGPTPAAAPTPVCRADVFGTVCRQGGPTTPLTNSDYGAVYVMATPPVGVTEQAVKANKGGWKNWLKRYFVPGVKTGQIVLELRLGAGDRGRLLAAIPVASFTIDEKQGVKVETQQAFSDLVQATPYFRLDPNSNQIQATLTVRSTSDPSSNILASASDVTKAAATLGGHGWLVSAVADPAIQGALGGIQARIVQNTASNVKATIPVTISFETSSEVDYNYGLDPKGADRSGRVFIRLIRRPSLFGGKTTAASVPDYGIPNRTDLGATQFFLARSVNATQDFAAFIAAQSAGQLAHFQEAGVTPETFNSACSSVKTVVRSQELGLNMHDVEAVLWATWIAGQNAARPAIQDSACMRGELAAFQTYGLKVPDRVPDPVPDSDRVPDPNSNPGRNQNSGSGSNPGRNSAQLSPQRLKTFVEGIVMHDLAQGDSGPARIRSLSDLFWDDPHPVIKVDTEQDIANLTETSNARALAEKLAVLQFKSGCYYRDKDQTVRFLGRLVAPATPDAAGELWLFVLGLRSSSPSTATLENTRISAFMVKTPEAADFDAMKRALPDRTSCHTAELAPG
jgi:hypothetical protein